ncbi:HAD family hydrolase [Eggerthellaceae bacterium 3-80]|nr:HAD family hydrolase [bacterium D16-34]
MSNAPCPPERTYRAICFDLDGTLLPMDLDEFMNAYFSLLGECVAQYGVSWDDFVLGMKAGIQAMATHTDGRTNEEVFWEHYFSFVDPGACNWPEVLGDFYEHDFGKLGDMVVPNPAAASAVATLAEKGYPLILATMPMFPRRAVEWRLRWAGVDPEQFVYITTFDNSTSAKPHTSYYQGVLDKLAGASGEDVLMVGNNTVEDLAFCKLGADAFLVTDNLIDPVGFDLASVRHGSLADFAAWANMLPSCQNPACVDKDN